MGDRFDVVIVGARCAGSPLAIQLARNGLRVAVIDRASFPSDSPSTHFFQAEGVASLERLGVLERLEATGAPFIRRASWRVEDVVRDDEWPTRPGDAGGGMSVRRPVLDTILLGAAQEAGAEVRTSTKVTGVIREDGRVHGVRTVNGGKEAEFAASLVIGADGRGSTVGDLVGARFYNVAHGERFAYWAYYEGVRPSQPNTAWFHRWDEELVIGFPCDGGVFLAGVIPPATRLADFTASAQNSFDAHIAMCEPVAEMVNAPGVKRVGRLRRMSNIDGYLRESAGPGWALVGDAGHFKDPTPAQGISDALRQVDKLAPAIIGGLGGARSLDESLKDWWRWRDDDAVEHYWFACDLGKAGRVPYAFVEGLHSLMSTEGSSKFLDLLNHRAKPSDFLTPSFMARATWGLMRNGKPSRRVVLKEVGQLMTQEVRRRRLNKRPQFASAAEITPSYHESDLATLA